MYGSDAQFGLDTLAHVIQEQYPVESELCRSGGYTIIGAMNARPGNPGGSHLVWRGPSYTTHSTRTTHVVQPKVFVNKCKECGCRLASTLDVKFCSNSCLEDWEVKQVNEARGCTCGWADPAFCPNDVHASAGLLHSATDNYPR